jgi:hypothetical protein
MFFLLVSFLIAFRLLFHPSITSGMWVLKHTAQTIDAATKLIQAIAPRKNSNEKRGDRKED